MPMFDSADNDITFRSRLLGFDRREVRAFIANIVEDYEHLRNELERLRGQGTVGAPEAASAMGTTAREVQRVLEGAQRVANDVERRAAEESAHVVEAAHTQAAEIVATAQKKAMEITAGARRDLASLEARAVTLQTQLLKLRAAFESAADTAGTALSEIAEATAQAHLVPGEKTTVGA
jgi:cell division septum initiation protein DivIVA